MSRNRRNARKNKGIKNSINIRNFLTIISVLLIIIFICMGIYQYKIYEDKKMLAKQKEELDKQTEEIFSALDDNIEQTNKNILEKDTIIKISTVGDILCGQEMLTDAYNADNSTYEFSNMFKQVSSYINRADIVMGTMETNFADQSYHSQNAPKEFAKAVKESGVNLVTICHNHSLDYGIKGLKETKNTLKSLEYEIVGDKLDGDNAVFIKDIKDTKIAILTYTYGINNQSGKTKKELDSINLYKKEQVKKDMKYAKEKGAQYICVLIHWGDAISGKVNQKQKEMADFLINQGADMILGSHPSVVQPMEVRKNKDGKNVFVAYSIGTYISTLAEENTKIELVLNIELRKSGKDGKVYLDKVDYTPIYVLDNGSSSGNRYELIDMKDVAKSYTEGNTDKITRGTYNKLISGLKRLEEILKVK